MKCVVSVVLCVMLLCCATVVFALSKTFVWDHDGVNTKNYNIYRSTNNGTAYTNYGQVVAGTKTFTDNTVPVNMPMCYHVTAVGDGGESGHSTPVCFQVPSQPQVPMNFKMLP